MEMGAMVYVEHSLILGYTLDKGIQFGSGRCGYIMLNCTHLRIYNMCRGYKMEAYSLEQGRRRWSSQSGHSLTILMIFSKGSSHGLLDMRNKHNTLCIAHWRDIFWHFQVHIWLKLPRSMQDEAHPHPLWLLAWPFGHIFYYKLMAGPD